MFDVEENHNWGDAEDMAFAAYELYEDGQMSEALKQLSDAIEINSNNSAWFFNAGLTLDAMDRFKDAIAAYEHALELNPDDPEILNSLAVDYTRIAQYDLAIEIFEKIQTIDPHFEPCYCNRIITYTEMEKHEKAEEMFYLAQQINPDCPICFYNIGNSIFSNGNYKRAIWCWQRTAELEPEHPQINYRIAQAHWANGNRHLAKVHFLKELRKNPGDIRVIFDFGLFLLEHGNIESAKEKFHRILELDSTYAPALLYLGDIALSQHQTKRAKLLFLQAQRRDHELTGPGYRLAQLAFAEGDRNRARQLLKDEATLDIEDVDVLISMGSMLIQLGQPDRATDCFLRAVDEDPTNTEAFYFLGLTLVMKRQFEGALQFFEYAISLGNENPDLLADAAFLYLRSGQLSLARQTLKNAPESAKNYKRLARLSILVKSISAADTFAEYLLKRPAYRVRLLLTRYKCRIRQLLNRLR